MDGAAPIRTATERAAAEVYEVVRAAAYEAARDAATQAIRDAVGLDVEVISLDDRVTRAEAALRLGTTQQTLIRLEKKGTLPAERTSDGRVYVRLSDAREALSR